MATINEYFNNAMVSEASYANLYAGMSDKIYIDILDASGMKPALAKGTEGFIFNQ